MTEPKEPMTDAERLLHEAFRGLLLKRERGCAYGCVPAENEPEGPEDIDDPVDREKEDAD